MKKPLDSTPALKIASHQVRQVLAEGAGSLLALGQQLYNRGEQHAFLMEEVRLGGFVCRRPILKLLSESVELCLPVLVPALLFA